MELWESTPSGNIACYLGISKISIFCDGPTLFKHQVTQLEQQGFHLPGGFTRRILEFYGVEAARASAGGAQLG